MLYRSAGIKISVLFFLTGVCSVAESAVVQHLDAAVVTSVIGSPVTEWADLSSSGHPASNAVGNVYYPGASLSASGKQGLDFGTERNTLQLFSADRSDQWLNQTAATGGFCIMVAFKCDELHSDWNDLIGNSSAVNNGFGMRWSSTGSYQVYLDGNIGVSGSLAAGDTVVFALNYDSVSGDWVFWDSNNDSEQSGNKTAADFSTGNGVTLGGMDSGLRFFKGMVGEVKVFDAPLSDVDFSVERMALKRKWVDEGSQPTSGWRVIPEDEDYPTDDVVMAYCSVADPIYSLPADPANADCTAAFQAALDDASTAGGGTVFVPEGEYRIDGTLTIDSNVILRGRWREPSEIQPVTGTVLALYNTGSNAIFRIQGGGSGVRDLAFWHPEQDAANPTNYPFVIQGAGKQTTIENITLVNAYDGIDMSEASMCCLRGVYGSPMHVGLTADRSFAVSRFDSIHFSPDFWAWSGLPGSPSMDGPHKTYIRANGLAVHIREMDGFYFSFSTISGYSKGVFFQAGISGDDPHGDLSYVTVMDCDIALYVEEAKSFKILGCTFDGSVYGVYGEDGTSYNMNTCTVKGGVNSFNLRNGSAKVVNSTLIGPTIGGVNEHTYPTVMPVFNTSYEKVRKPSRTDLFNVSDFGAVGDGVADDTAAIQTAVAAANANGGGIVFVPDGEYRMTGNLALENGVELRGNSGGRHVAESRRQLGSLLLIEAGQGDADGTPFLTLGDYCGLRGIAFHYPVQADPGLMPHPDPDSTYFIPYPYMVQANGEQNYIIDCSASNPYQAAELNGDNHLVEYTFFGGLRRTYRANNCSGGRIQNCHIKPDFWRDIWLPGHPASNLGGFKWDVNKILEVFYLNNCTDYSISSIFNHASHRFMTVDNSSGQTLMISAEQVQQGYTLLNGSKTFEFLNSSCNVNVIGNRHGTYGIKSFPDYNGFARYYVSSIWGTADETWYPEDGHLYLQQCYFSGPSDRGAMNILCGADGALTLHACGAGEPSTFDNQGSVTMRDTWFSGGFIYSDAAEFIPDNTINSVVVMADLNQNSAPAFGLALDMSNIQMEDALIMAGSTPASESRDGRRVRAARLTEGHYSLDVTDPGFTDGARPDVTFNLQFLIDTACTIQTYYDNGSGMVLGNTKTFDGSAANFWNAYSFSVNDAWFGSAEDIRIEITGDSPLLAKAAVNSTTLPNVHAGAVVIDNGDGDNETVKTWTLSELNHTNPVVSGSSAVATGIFTAAGDLEADASFSLAASSVIGWNEADALAAIATDAFGDYLDGLIPGTVGALLTGEMGADSRSVYPDDDPDTLGKGSQEALVFTVDSADLSSGTLYLMEVLFHIYTVNDRTDFVIFDASENSIVEQAWDKSYNGSSRISGSWMLGHGDKIIIGTGSSNGIEQYRVNTLTLDVVPALTGYENWAASYGGPGLIGSETHDYDAGGQANLSEYALGGNPLDALDEGVWPTLFYTNGTMQYIHPQRTDDASLVYTLETSTNLVSGVWTNMNYTITEANVPGQTLSIVTNHVPATEQQLFFQLKTGFN